MLVLVNMMTYLKQALVWFSISMRKPSNKQFMTDIANNAGASTVGYKLG